MSGQTVLPPWSGTAISTSTLMEVASTERGQVKGRREVIPEPTVTEGIISKLGTELTQTGTTTVRGTLGWRSLPSGQGGP